MFLIYITVIIALLKFADVAFVRDISWWWAIGLFFFTFIWFEVFERLFGLDKKRLHEKFEEIQKRRAKRLLEKK
jgi:small Trp-rich protein